MPGVAYVDHGARTDFIVPGKLDRGGAINTITPHNITSKNCAGMVVSGFLVDVAPVDVERFRREYPEVFTKPYSDDRRPRVRAGAGKRPADPSAAAALAGTPCRERGSSLRVRGGTAPPRSASGR